jgi:Ca2+-binding EF-hand superfamily protein
VYTISNLKGQEQSSMVEAFKLAYKDQYISKDEFEQIYLSAINRSKLTETAEVTAQNTKPKTEAHKSKRGC